MTAIVSPRPRPAYPSRPLTSSRPLLSPMYLQDSVRVSSHKRTLFSPPQLASPIDLFDPRANKAYISKSSTSCSPNKRRRSLTYSTVRSPRRRHCSRAECPISPLGGPALFDRLPWISQLEAAPAHVSVFDTADLSLLAEEISFVESPSTDSIPRWVAPLRSDLFPSSPTESIDYFTRPGVHVLPAYALLSPDRFPSEPRTPPPRERFVPSEVRFHGLRPAFPLGLDDERRPSRSN